MIGCVTALPMGNVNTTRQLCSIVNRVHCSFRYVTRSYYLNKELCSIVNRVHCSFRIRHRDLSNRNLIEKKSKKVEPYKLNLHYAHPSLYTIFEGTKCWILPKRNIENIVFTLLIIEFDFILPCNIQFSIEIQTRVANVTERFFFFAFSGKMRRKKIP